jgi:hypothetical protein
MLRPLLEQDGLRSLHGTWLRLSMISPDHDQRVTYLASPREIPASTQFQPADVVDVNILAP